MSESENAATGGDRRRPASESDSENDMLGRASTLHESLTGWGTTVTEFSDNGTGILLTSVADPNPYNFPGYGSLSKVGLDPYL